MDTVMLVIFFIGVGYTLFSVIAGDLFGLEMAAGEHPYLSPTVIATFMAVFGGVGYLIVQYTSWSAVLAGGVALLAALGVSSLVLFLIVIPLHAAQNGIALSVKEMIGREAQVITPIENRRIGEIVYEQGGLRHNAPATTMDESDIPSGCQVRITGESAGIFVVARI